MRASNVSRTCSRIGGNFRRNFQLTVNATKPSRVVPTTAISAPFYYLEEFTEIKIRLFYFEVRNYVITNYGSSQLSGIPNPNLSQAWRHFGLIRASEHAVCCMYRVVVYDDDVRLEYGITTLRFWGGIMNKTHPPLAITQGHGSPGTWLSLTIILFTVIFLQSIDLGATKHNPNPNLMEKWKQLWEPSTGS
jgi:hypothetical protein